MKAVLLIVALVSFNVCAHTVKGILPLEGKRKTVATINGSDAVCRVRISDVKNSRTEDFFGNPAYKFKAEVSISGKEVGYGTEQTLTNLLKDGVNDYVYKSNGITLTINDDGRIVSLELDTKEYGEIYCRFSSDN